MPYSRPTLSDLRTMVAQDIQAELPGTDPLLRFSSLGIIGRVLAGLVNLFYGFLDWIAKQAVPFTATDEYLEGWAALKGVFREAAAPASGTVTFTGNVGAAIDAGATLTRSDGIGAVVTVGGTVGAGGTVTVTAQINADPTGLTGAFGNCPEGTQFTLGSAISGISSVGTAATAFTGGADLEGDDSLRSRMLLAYQTTPQGGAATDYVEWAREVPGVTRAWCTPNGMGPGTVVIRFMMDVSEAAAGGFPQGSNGVAAGEVRDIPATGDQLAVANYVFPKQPVTALVYSVAPIADTVDFTISGLTGASSALQASIAAAITGVFEQYGEPGGTIDLSYIEAAIAAIAGTAGFVIASPAANIVSPTGEFPVLGTVTYA